MSDLWPEIQSIESEENNAIQLLREQARAIEKKTNGVIKASFAKVTYKKNGLSEVTKLISTFQDVSIIEEDTLLNTKTDVNTLYQLEKYKFEIYSNTYKFRVFILENRSIFPIFINIDEEICDELKCQPREEIDSNKDLENLVTSVFHSKKIITILSKMLEDKNNTPLDTTTK